MGIPNTWCDCKLISAALQKTKLMVRKCANSISLVPIHSILSSGTRRLTPFVRWREGRPAMSRSLPPPTSIQFLTLRVRSDARHHTSLQFRWSSVFELCDFGPFSRWRARRTTRRIIEPFVKNWVLRRHFTPRHRRSVLHGTPNAWRDCSLRSASLERTELMVGRMRTALERSPSTASGYRSLAGSRRLTGGLRSAPPCVGSLPTPQSFQFVPLRVRSDASQPSSFQFRWRFVFDCATACPLAGGVRGVPR
jgi:hypothetical protein